METGTEDFELYCAKRAEIDVLETQQTLRLMREAVTGNSASLATLQSIQDQIAILRSAMAVLDGG
jgi:hypothetical protein